MAADDETLMDVFIGIQPKPDFLASVDRMADEASKRLIQKFGSIKLPGPQIGGPTVINTAADQERTRLLKEQEAINRKIAEAEERIAKAKSNRGNRNTPAAEEKAAKALADAQREMLRNEEALQALYRQNPYLKQMADVNAIADQILKHSEDRKRAEKEQRVLIQQTEQAQLKLNKLQGEGAIRTTQAMVDEARARAAAANAEVARRQKSLDEADTPLKTKRRATALGESQEAARQAEKEAADLEAKRAASLGRRDEQRANAAKNLADALALQAAGAQRLEQIDAKAIVTATELAQKRLLAVQAFEESEKKVADAQAKLNSIQANIGPATAAKQKELNDATEEFNRLQKERADISQRLIDIEKQLAVVAVSSVSSKSQSDAPAEKKQRLSKKEIENQKQILELEKQQEASLSNIADIERRLESNRRRLNTKKPNTVGFDNQQQKIAALEQSLADARAEQDRIVQQLQAARSGSANGAAGSPPRGGKGNPANAFRAQFREELEDETRRVTELDVSLDRLFEAGPKNPEITRKYQILKDVLADARRELGYLSKDIRTSDASEIGSLRDRLQVVSDQRVDLSRSIFGTGVTQTGQVYDPGGARRLTDLELETNANKELIDILIRKNQIIKEEDDIRFRLVQRLNQGVAFSDKAAIAEASSQVELAQREFNRLAKESNGSKESLDRLTESFVRLNGLMNLSGDEIDRLGLGAFSADPGGGFRGARREIQTEASTRNYSSTNTLSNNAYQLGQAIEDFSVGYSLNGFAGGVRGAANNVAFLLNNLSQSDRFVNSLANGFVKIRGVIPVDRAKQMAERLALSIPLVAGIGSAIAIVILPKMIEWLESLNDIPVKFDDISEKINRDFSNLEFDVKLNADERQFLRTIQNANELREILEQLKGTVDEAQDQKIDLIQLFAGFGESQDIRKVVSDLGEFRKLIALEQKRFEADQKTQEATSEIAKTRVPFFLRGFLPEKNIFNDFSDQAKKSASDMELFGRRVNELVEDIQTQSINGEKGIFDARTLKILVDEFYDLQKIFETIKKTDISDPAQIDNFQNSFNSLRDVIESFSRASQQIESSNRRIVDGLELARQKAAEFAQEQLLIRQVINDTANEEVLFAFDIVRTVNALGAAIEKVRQQSLESAKRTGGDQDLVNQRADALREALRLETENQLLLRRKDIERQINDLQSKRNGNSELTSLDKISQDLIRSQLSVDDESKKAFKDLTEQLQILNTTISVMNANISGAGGTLEMATRTVPFGGGSAVALGAAIDFSSMSFMMRDAVAAGVREAMAGQQKPVVEVLEKVNSGINRINAGAQN